jgi:hypothetical protein
MIRIEGIATVAERLADCGKPKVAEARGKRRKMSQIVALGKAAHAIWSALQIKAGVSQGFSPASKVCSGVGSLTGMST